MMISTRRVSGQLRYKKNMRSIRFMLPILFFACLVFLSVSSAFGGGMVEWPSPQPPAGTNPAIFPVPNLGSLDGFQKSIDQAHQMPKLDLIFDGDSITAGWGDRGQGHGVWNGRYGKLNAIDFGIPGDGTQQVLWRLQNGEVDNLHPKLIVLMIGTNNIYRDSPEQVAEAIKLIIGEYQKRCPDAAILLLGIFPRSESPTDKYRAWIKSTNQIISQFGDGKKVIYLDIGDKFLQPDGTLTKEIMGDSVHPTAKGYEIWADAIQPVIDQFFGAQPAPPSPAPAP
jgi:lysophospholipase L1-like esterase